jgi:O-antigen ligase
MAVLTVPAIIFCSVDNRKRALALVAAGICVLVVMLVDPSFSSLLDDESTAVQYISRGQTADQIKGVSGRAELWEIIWEEYWKSPLIGHGYFVTSEAGEFRAWYMTANFTAHNIYLQILASTGLIGFLLFAAAMVSLATAFWSLLRFDRLARQVAVMLILIAIWYLGWSLLCVSFVGPVRGESVFFFAFVGVGLGQVARFRHSTANAKATSSSIAVSPIGSSNVVQKRG